MRGEGHGRKARAAGEDTFTYGLMHQRQACQAAAMEQALPRLRNLDPADPSAIFGERFASCWTPMGHNANGSAG